jgi:hypothetical protein
MSPLSDNDHDVLRKLANELLPWMAAGALLRRRWFIHVACLYSYGSEAITAAGALGVESSVIPAFRGSDVKGFDIATAFSGSWFWPGMICLVGWTALRIVIAREDVVAKAIFARDCARAMQKFQHDLDRALVNPDPQLEIEPIEVAVARKVAEAIDKGVWSWSPPFPKTPDVALEVSRRIADIRARFSHNWAKHLELRND